MRTAKLININFHVFKSIVSTHNANRSRNLTVVSLTVGSLTVIFNMFSCVGIWVLGNKIYCWERVGQSRLMFLAATGATTAAAPGDSWGSHCCSFWLFLG